MGAAGLDHSELDHLAHHFFLKGLASSTLRAYRSAQRRYGKFCAEDGLQAVPASEEGLCRFVARLAGDGLKHRTIKSYLAGVRHLHIEEGLADPFLQPLHRLHYTLRGVKRCEGERGEMTRERLPISPDILKKIKAVWDQGTPGPDKIMLWAACCLAFFGFLRAGELTVPGDASFDPTTHLVREDLAVDNPSDPAVLQLRLKASKTDPFRKGMFLYIGKGSPDLCPVTAALSYLLVRGRRDGPLFMFSDGRFLTRQRFVVAVRDALKTAGIECSKYCGHSFRIGAATTAASRGMEDAVIKTLGRWKSLAYLEYIKIPRQQLASYSSLLS